ncbi:MAG TPA: cation-translocating P-type ATPase [Oligoflexus sp.]|uniref:cation-translocating P-type ATPase n=1 Tax=Oligoflexus sp. TaxID=1971216 RepID=UPI002D8078C0|nr:cation-translocating P-type ATPase [Oligoflexus sp.]HET9238634.1 cation-translocating P-type ATPase [Oligoflexus sp.]
MPPIPSQPYALTLERLKEYMQTDPERGLSDDEVQRRLGEYGSNQLEEETSESWLIKFFKQFQSVLIVILIVAAAMAGLMGEWTETWAILAIVLLNGVIGFFQEARAEQAIASLRQLASPQARVIRSGASRLIAAVDLVPGDLIELEAGDFVPADTRLIEAYDCRCQEAALTGESVPVHKKAQPPLAEKTILAERSNMLFMGTTVLSGRAKGFVVATGMQTELGHIAGILQRQPQEPTPLQLRLAELGRILIVLCLGMIALIFALYSLRGDALKDVFLFAISLAVAVIPEGLPAFVTIALALGLTRMAKRNALIRRLPSVETLGSVTVICTDKTGTLTRNEMTVRVLEIGPYAYEVSGSGYQREGAITRTREVEGLGSGDDDLHLALWIGARCNHAKIIPEAAPSQSWSVLGDPTEAALLIAADKAGIAVGNDPLLQNKPFDERKRMSIVVQAEGGGPMMLMKGAAESLLSCCAHELWDGQVRRLSPARRQEILNANHAMSSRALRVLGLAFRSFPAVQTDYKEDELIYVGLVGMMDPPRDEAKAAIRSCLDAGIMPVMITGDHPATARAIAMELGLTTADGRVMTGQDIDDGPLGQLEKDVAGIAVYARVTPEHKLKVIEAWKKHGAIVAMTGDGVNDAPAVKAADIGIAMGITGTDVTKEASDIILMDDNFVSIVNAVEEGRGILDNIKNIIHYLLAGNVSEVLLVLTCVIVGWPLPLQPMQILWINLATDGFPALALAAERPEPGIMRRKPRPVKEPILSWGNGRRILGHGLLLTAMMLIGFYWSYALHPPTRGQLPLAQTVTFFICAFAQLFFALGCRSQTQTYWSRGALSNPALIGALIVAAGLQFAIVYIPALRVIFLRADPKFGLDTWMPMLILAIFPVSIVELIKIGRGVIRSGSKP